MGEGREGCSRDRVCQAGLEPGGEKPPTTRCWFIGRVFGRGMMSHPPGWGCCESSPTGGISQGGMSPAQPVPNAGLLLFIES